MAAEGYESGYESGMNRGMNRGTYFFSTGKTPRVPQEHKDSLCFTATVAQDRQLFPPRRTDCRKQAPSFKLSSGTPRHSALQVPASYVKLHPPTTDATDNSSTRTSAGLLYNSIMDHMQMPQFLQVLFFCFLRGMTRGMARGYGSGVWFGV